MRWKALAEIYKMHSFAPLSTKVSSMFCLTIANIFCQFYDFLPNFAKLFVKISLEFVNFRADFYRNFAKSCRIKKISDIKLIFAENCEIL